jgi:hypothetical protein
MDGETMMYEPVSFPTNWINFHTMIQPSFSLHELALIGSSKESNVQGIKEILNQKV